MARKPRIFIPDVSVHVIHRGINRAAIVRDDTDRRVFMALLQRSAARHLLAVHGFAVMDTHYHLLVTPPDPSSLAETMKELGERYVGYFNQRHGRIGTLCVIGRPDRHHVLVDGIACDPGDDAHTAIRRKRCTSHQQQRR